MDYDILKLENEFLKAKVLVLEKKITKITAKYQMASVRRISPSFDEFINRNPEYLIKD